MSWLKENKLKFTLSLLSFVVLFWFLSNKAKQTYNAYVPGDYHASIFADPAGYYVYLPGVIDGWFTGQMPKGADSICGYGFTLNEQGKIISKYPYGVALLQSPFYVGSKIYAKISNQEFNAYNELSQITIDFAGISYAIIGLILLFFYLQKRTSTFAALLTVIAILIGTNVYYYIVKCPGYSHVYSFFLFVCLLQSSSYYFSNQNIKRLALLVVVATLIILARPMNIIFIPFILFTDVSLFSETLVRIKSLFTLKNLIVIFAVFFLLFLPQLIYWKWAYGSFLPDTYSEEGFSNALKPRLFPYLFAPLNGLLPYSPLYVLFLLTMLIFVKINRVQAITIIVIMSVMIYLSTAWYTYSMGCGFSARNFVEFSALLSIPFAFFIHRFLTKFIFKLLFVALMILPICINQKLAETFDMCFFGTSEWDWKEYKYLLYQNLSTIEVDANDKLNYTQEKQIITDPADANNKCFRSLNTEYFSTIRIPFKAINKVPPMMCAVKLDLNNQGKEINFDFAVQVMREGKQVFYTSVVIQNNNPGWYPVYQQAYFPKDLQLNDELVIFLWNKHGNDFLADKFEIKMR